jgi:histidine triad (HIT) family protein
MRDCIFCQIAAKQIESNIVYEDEQVTAFHDVRPAAPTHLLIIPKTHIESINEIAPEHESLLGHLFTVSAYLAEQEGVKNSGYRLIINNGPDAGQAVFHIHMHLLAGQPLKSLG